MADVSGNPKNPSIQGLQNLTADAWTLTGPMVLL